MFGSHLAELAFCADHDPTGDGHRLALERFWLVLGLEGPTREAGTAGRASRGARMDTEDEPRESTLGRSADSRRVAQARHRHGRDECEQVLGAPPQPALSNLANLPGEPREVHGFGRLLYGTIRFEVLYVLLVLAHERRRILHFG